MTRYRSKFFQAIRLMDMLYVAPVMIIAGLFGKTLPMYLRVSLVSIGVFTIIFNTINYVDTYKYNQENI